MKRRSPGSILSNCGDFTIKCDVNAAIRNVRFTSTPARRNRPPAPAKNIQARPGTAHNFGIMRILGKLQGVRRSRARSSQHIFVGRNGRLYCRRSGFEGETLVPHIAVQGFPDHYFLEAVERQEEIPLQLGGGSGRVALRSGRRVRREGVRALSHLASKGSHAALRQFVNPLDSLNPHRTQKQVIGSKNG